MDAPTEAVSASQPRLSNLDIVEKADNFPRYLYNPEGYRALMQHLYHFYISGFSTPLSYVHINNLASIALIPSFSVDYSSRSVTLTFPSSCTTPSARTAHLAPLLQAACSPTAPILPLRKWYDEQVSLHYFQPQTSSLIHVLDVDRAGSSLLSLPGAGVHMTGYVGSLASPASLRIWVPRRAADKSTYAGMLDNTVGGTLRAGEAPLDCIVREAVEELCIPEAYTRQHIVPCGTIISHPCYLEENAPPRGPAEYDRQTQFIYEMEIRDNVVLEIGDGEVAEVSLMGVDEVRQRLARDEFKLNTTLTYLAFFVRHGIVTAENEPHFQEICARMQRPWDIYKIE